mgnify:CR=1 FL=1
MDHATADGHAIGNRNARFIGNFGDDRKPDFMIVLIVRDCTPVALYDGLVFSVFYSLCEKTLQKAQYRNDLINFYDFY